MTDPVAEKMARFARGLQALAQRLAPEAARLQQALAPFTPVPRPGRPVDIAGVAVGLGEVNAEVAPAAAIKALRDAFGNHFHELENFLAAGNWCATHPDGRCWFGSPDACRQWLRERAGGAGVVVFDAELFDVVAVVRSIADVQSPQAIVVPPAQHGRRSRDGRKARKISKRKLH